MAQISLRPLTLGPGGGAGAANPFAAFGAGAGAGLRGTAAKVRDGRRGRVPGRTSTLSAGAHARFPPPPSQADPASREERKKKAPSEIVRYDRDVLMSMAKVGGRGGGLLARGRAAGRQSAARGRRGAARPLAAPAGRPRHRGARSDRWRARSGPRKRWRPQAGPWRGARRRPPSLQANTAPAPAALASIPDLALDAGAEAPGARAAAAAADAAAAAGGDDARDWRARPDAAAPAGGGGAAWDAGKTGPPAAAHSGAGGGVGAAPAILRAADQGRVAWAPAAASAGDGAALKALTGVLNKLTPEKFDRLAEQAAALVTSAAVLRGAISLLFENAIAQPTFAATYADLCAFMAARVPEFPADAPGGKPASFRRVLLNTCQEEFEAATAADGTSRAGGKARTLGAVRLIAELFKAGVVAERVVHACVSDLLGDGVSASHDALEAVCEVLTVCGKRLDEGDARARAAVDGYCATLARIAASPTLPSRIRFMLRDALDLRAAAWVPRREGLQAKKLADVHADAAAELGLLPPTLLPALASLPALPRGTLAAPGDDVDLFPAFRGDDAGFERVAASRGEAAVGGTKVASSFLGEYTHVPTAVVAEPPPVAAAPAPGKPARGPIKEADRESLTKSLFSDYLATKDDGEAVETALELVAGPPGSASALVDVGLDRMLDAATEADSNAVSALLLTLLAAGAVDGAAFADALGPRAAALADIALDAPKAPALISGLLGGAIAAGKVDGTQFGEMVEGAEGGEARRDLVEIVAKATVAAGGDAKAAVEGLDLEALLKADEEIDPPDLEPVAAFLKRAGLA